MSMNPRFLAFAKQTKVLVLGSRPINCARSFYREKPAHNVMAFVVVCVAPKIEKETKYDEYCVCTASWNYNQFENSLSSAVFVFIFVVAVTVVVVDWNVPFATILQMHSQFSTNLQILINECIRCECVYIGCIKIAVSIQKIFITFFSPVVGHWKVSICSVRSSNERGMRLMPFLCGLEFKPF